MNHLLPALVLAAGTLAAANPIRNSSFELGRADFGVSRYIRPENKKVFLEPVFDANEKIHGRQSIRFDNPGADMIELAGREYQLAPGKTYTFSWYMKSSRPISVRAGQYVGEMVTPTFGDWSMFTAHSFQCTTGWKRYSFTFTAKGKRSWYFPLFRWNADGAHNDATLWIDALQIDEGKTPASYAPAAPVEAAICGDKRVRVRGSRLAGELRIVNHTDQPQTVKAELNINDTLMPQIKFPARTVTRTVPGKQSIAVPLSTETKRIGHFRLAGTFHAAGSRLPLGDWFFSEIPEPQNRKADPRREYTTGINCDLGLPIRPFVPNAYRAMNGAGDEEFAEFLKNSGVTYLRLHDGGLLWKNIEPEPGKFNWSVADDRFGFALRNGFSLMPVLGNMFYLRDRDGKKRSHTPLPGWLIRSPATEIHKMNGSWDGVSPDPRAWERFAAAIATRYKGKIAAYEITNEPNIALPSAKEYIPYLKSAARILKKIDPATSVIGGSITTDYGGKTDQFLNDMGKSGVLNDCAALSFHPYASPLDSSAISAQSAIRELRKLIDRYAPGLPLWNTELYYIGPAASAHYAVAGTASHAHHLLRRHLIDLGEGVARSMLITNQLLQQNELAPHWELGNSLVYSGYVPHDLYVGQSVASRLLTGAKPLERLNWPSGAAGYRYRMYDGSELAAFWKSPDARKFTLKLAKGSYELLDMYLNPLPNNGELVLTEYPVFLRGKTLQAVLKQSELQGEQSFRILSAFQVPERGEKILMLEIQNISPENIVAAVRPDFAEHPQKTELAVNQRKFLRFPGGEKAVPGTSKVYLADNRRNFTLPLPPLQKKLIREKETGKGNGFSFTTSSTGTTFRIEIAVDDPVRGPRTADAPWEGDSIELFFDSAPLADPGDTHAGKTIRRLFLAPGSSNGLPAHKSAIGMNAADVTCRITEDRNGYRAELEIPWNELGMKSAGIMGLDVKINNADRSGKVTSAVWSGTDRNHRFRHCYGLWYPSVTAPGLHH